MNNKREISIKIVNSAIEIFSRDGYSAASLREIAIRAGTPLSAIHRCFGSKADLYAEAENFVWQEINEERGAMLDVLLSGGAPPSLDALFHALFYPVVRRAMDRDEGSRRVQLVRNAVELWRQRGRPSERFRGYRHMRDRWMEAIAHAAPPMPRIQAIWVYSFASGALFSWQIIDGWFDEMDAEIDQISAEEATALLVTFCRGGYEAAAQLRNE